MQLFDESKAMTQQGLVCQGLNREGLCPDPRLYLVQNLASVFNPATGTFEHQRGTLQITCPHSRPTCILVDSDDESEEDRAVRAQLAVIRNEIQQIKASMAADISDDEEEDVAMHRQPLPVKQESSCCCIC